MQSGRFNHQHDDDCAFHCLFGFEEPELAPYRPGGSARYGPSIRCDSGPVLLRMLSLQQPNNHDFAYSILKLLSGQDFGPTDVAAWKRWCEKERGLSPRP